MRKLRVGVIGAGAVSDAYLKNMTRRFPSLEAIAIASAHGESARKKAEQYHLEPRTVGEIMGDPQIEAVLVLTPAGSHYELIRQALDNGKHVYTEKPLTTSPETALELLRLADEKGLCLGSAPDTFLGSAFQTARKAIDEGILGEIHSFAISATRCNDLLLSLFPHMREPGCGSLYGYAVYYITALVSLLGPVAKAAAMISTPYPQHTGILPGRPDYGKTFSSPNESQVSAILQLESGVTGSFHLDADSLSDDEAFFSIYGTKGILRLSDPNQFGGEVWFVPNVPEQWVASQRRLLKPVSDLTDNCRGIGLEEMAEAIFSGRHNRANKEMAYHVLETLSGMYKSGKDSAFYEIQSTCQRPAPMQIEPPASFHP